MADASGVVGNRAYYFSSQSYVTKNADVIHAVIEEIKAVDQWGKQHPDELASELGACGDCPNPSSNSR